MNDPTSRRTAPILLVVLILLLPAVATAQPQLGRDGRWMTLDGEYRYVVGWDSQQFAADPSIDLGAKLGQLRAYDVNKLRIWLYNYYDDRLLYPWRVVGGKMDLEQWDPAFWSRMRALVEAAQPDILVEVTLFAPTHLGRANHWVGLPGWGPNAWNETQNLNGVFEPNSRGTLIPEFFHLDHVGTSHSGKSLRDYQRELVTKAIDELGGYSNVFFEICNEFPLLRSRGADANGAMEIAWQRNWIDRVDAQTSNLVTVHAQQASGANTTGAVHYASYPGVDALNFHFYNYSPNRISDLLRGADPNSSPVNLQGSDKLLWLNEGGRYFNDDGSLNSALLDQETRAAWAMLTAGGYYSFYEDVPQHIGSNAWRAAAERARALRRIAESLRFWEMSPVDGALQEYDSLVQAGPTPGNWQVLADPGSQYLVYFWDAAGSASGPAVQIQLPEGNYDYVWYDVRRAATVLASGTVTGGGVSTVPRPPNSAWRPQAGVALTLVRHGAEGFLAGSSSCTTLSGWARDSDTAAPVQVDIYRGRLGAGGVLAASVLADKLRPDVGAHGFSLPTPSAFFTGQPEVVWAYARDLNSNGTPTGALSALQGSPKALTCVSAPPAPTAVGASDGTFTDRVRVTWNASPGAIDYEIWRHTGSDVRGAKRIGFGHIGTVFGDFSASPGQVYHYWVRARNETGISGFSLPDRGSRGIATTTMNLPAVDDSFVDRADRYRNFGAAGSFYIRGGQSGRTRHSFLKFVVPASVGEVLDARLRLRSLGPAIPGAALYRVRNTQWSEGSVNWDNWDRNGLVLTEVDTLQNLSFAADFDVTSAVPGNGSVTFGIASFTADSEGVEFWSREAPASASRPVLTVTTGSGQARTFQPIADSWTSQAAPNANFGAEPVLGIRAGGSDQGKFAFLEFRPAGLTGSVTSATLRMRVKTFVPEARLYRVDGTQWTEAGVTWENWDQNALGLQFLGATGALAGGQWHEIDVTGAEIEGGDVLTFGLTTSTDQHALGFSSDESSIYAPSLILTFEPR
ncbi:MAG: DNRLRE domain-containing protein [Acidobacteriota bacterium]